MQFEVLNLRRNANMYNDILAPNNYDMDFVFASVMVSNPLMWFELQNLEARDKQKLTSIIEVYKKYRDDFEDVTPILDEPNGLNLTGFRIKGKKNNYVIVIRDGGEEDTVDIEIKQILATNDENVMLSPIKFSKKKSYIFAIV